MDDARTLVQRPDSKPLAIEPTLRAASSGAAPIGESALEAPLPSAMTICKCASSSGRWKYCCAAATTFGSISATVKRAAGRCRRRNFVNEPEPSPIKSAFRGHVGSVRRSRQDIISRVYSSSSDHGRVMRMAPWIQSELKCR